MTKATQNCKALGELLPMMNDRNDIRLERLWGEGKIRAFISHKAEDKKLATDLKSSLREFGITSFVAHEDVEPMKEWQSEIERALFSMDILVALMTENFSESNWIDQEIGVAVGRGVRIFPIALGKDPYGFIGKYQAIAGSGKRSGQIALEIFSYLLRDDEVSDEAKDLAKDAYILAVARAGRWDDARFLSYFLDMIDGLSSQQEEDLVKAFNHNPEVYGSDAFPSEIVHQLKRMTGKTYTFDGNKLYRV